VIISNVDWSLLKILMKKKLVIFNITYRKFKPFVTKKQQYFRTEWINFIWNISVVIYIVLDVGLKLIYPNIVWFDIFLFTFDLF